MASRPHQRLSGTRIESAGMRRIGHGKSQQTFEIVYRHTMTFMAMYQPNPSNQDLRARARRATRPPRAAWRILRIQRAHLLNQVAQTTRRRSCPTSQRSAPRRNPTRPFRLASSRPKKARHVLQGKIRIRGLHLVYQVTELAKAADSRHRPARRRAMHVLCLMMQSLHWANLVIRRRLM